MGDDPILHITLRFVKLNTTVTYERHSTCFYREPEIVTAPQRAVLVGIDMPFGELVKHLVLISLAAIPAVIILATIAGTVVLLLGRIAGVLTKGTR
jgi:hypothetical protein